MKKILLIFGSLFVLFLSSCTKELSDNFNTYTNHPLNDTAWIKNLTPSVSINDLFDLTPPGIIIDSFNLNNAGTLKYGDSLEITYDGGSFVTPGSLILPTDSARIEIMPLKTKGDFIKTFKPTTTANCSLLETGGGYFIRVTKNGKELAIANNRTIEIKFNDLDSSRPNMQAFYGKEGSPVPVKGIDTSYSWIRDFDTTYLETWAKQSNNPLVPSYYGYKLKTKNLRWVTADRYLDSTLPKTKVTAILSPNFTNKNTAVFAVFNNQKTVVNLKGDYPSRSFNTLNIPLKSSIKLISLSKIGSDYYLGEKVISSVATVTSYTIVPVSKTLKEIITYLNSL